jgi:uncharacterized protein (TIGR00251 family)
VKPILAHPNPVEFSVYVQPGARRTEVAGFHAGLLKVRLAAPPADGKANAELVRFLAQAMGVSARQVRIVSGTSARRKRVAVTAPTSAIEALLRAAAKKEKP